MRRISSYIPAALLPVIVACGSGPDAGVPAAERPPLPVAATEVRERDLFRELTLSAVIEPRVVVRVASQKAGLVRQVTVEPGDEVAAGSLMVELDVAEERAEAARAAAREQEAALVYRRMAELLEAGLVSPAEYEGGAATLSVARSERELWDTRIAFGRITAPRSGVVTARFTEPGEAVQAQQVLLELASMDELVVRLGVPERDVGFLATGSTLKVSIDALPGESFSGTIRRIMPAAGSDSRLITVEVLLPPDAATRGVRAGFLARASTRIDQRTAVLAVPAAALGERDGGHFVYVISDGELSYRRVTPGATRSPFTEIQEGLAAGDVVLATNPVDLTDGQRVRIAAWRHGDS